jgi:predicted transcriptional regulator
MTETNTILTDDLRHQVEDLARRQNRLPGDVLAEAVRRYARVQTLERFAARAGRHARKLRIKEEDVPRLIDEVRRENETRGH